MEHSIESPRLSSFAFSAVLKNSRYICLFSVSETLTTLRCDFNSFPWWLCQDRYISFLVVPVIACINLSWSSISIGVLSNVREPRDRSFSSNGGFLFQSVGAIKRIAGASNRFVVRTVRAASRWRQIWRGICATAAVRDLDSCVLTVKCARKICRICTDTLELSIAACAFSWPMSSRANSVTRERRTERTRRYDHFDKRGTRLFSARLYFKFIYLWIIETLLLPNCREWLHTYIQNFAKLFVEILSSFLWNI